MKIANTFPGTTNIGCLNNNIAKLFLKFSVVTQSSLVLKSKYVIIHSSDFPIVWEVFTTRNYLGFLWSLVKYSSVFWIPEYIGSRWKVENFPRGCQ